MSTWARIGLFSGTCAVSEQDHRPSEAKQPYSFCSEISQRISVMFGKHCGQLHVVVAQSEISPSGRRAGRAVLSRLTSPRYPGNEEANRATSLGAATWPMRI